MTRRQKLLRNPRILFWGKALTELKTLNAIIVLFYLHRGVTVEQVFYLTLVWSLATLVFEVPSGYLADKIGRKRTMMLGSFVLLMAWVSTFFAQGFPAFIGVFVLMSLASSMFSGTEEATLYDSLKEVGKENEMTKHNGRMISARHLMKIFVPTIGVLIAKDLIEFQFRVLIGFDVVASIVSLIIFSRLVEPKHEKSVEEYEKGVYLNSLSIIKNNPFLLRLTLNKVLVFIGAVVVFRAYQPHLEEIGTPILWFAILYFFMHLIAFVSNWFVHILQGKFGLLRLLFWTPLGYAVSIAILGTTSIPIVACIAVLCEVFFVDVREPLFAEVINRRIDSRSRATTLSNLNVIKGLLDIPILLFAGYMATFGIRYVFIVPVILTLIAFFFFPIRKRDVVA